MKTLILAVMACLMLSAAPAVAQPKALTLGTASIGGTYAVYGGVVATLLTDTIGINVSTQQTQGPNQNIILIENGGIELGLTTMGIALQAWNGSAEWTKGRSYRNFRALFPMYDTPLHVVTTQKSDIKSLGDLNGRVIGFGPKAGTPGTYWPLVLDALGIKVTARFGQAADMQNQVADGLLDAYASGAGLPNPAFMEIEALRPVRFIGMSEQQIAVLRERMPELSESTIPKGTYKTLDHDQKTVGQYNFAIAHKDLPEDVAYRIVKSVLQSNDRLTKGHSAAKETVAANAVHNGFLPFHPGAVRYFKEAGVSLNPKTLPLQGN